MKKIDYFGVLAIQSDVRYCNSRAEIFENNLKRHIELVGFLVPAMTAVIGAKIRLVVFPEFAIHDRAASYLPGQVGAWNGVSIDIPGEETEQLSRLARKHGIFIASHAWQEYPDLKGRPLSIGFLIDPDGKIILKHHKTVPTRTAEASDAGPGDVYDWFVKKFGDRLDSFFPVVETELGKMGFLICGEGQYAECSRGLTMNGAEIILRPNAWVEPWLEEPMDMMTVLSRYAAYSNMSYLVEANWASVYRPGGPVGFGSGNSQVIDYMGRILARTHTTQETGVPAAINMESLRRHREEVGFGARIPYMPTHIFRKVYEQEMWPKNLLLNEAMTKLPGEWDAVRRQVIQEHPDVFTPSKGDPR